LQLFARLQSRSVSCIAVILIMLSFPQIQASGQRIEYFEKLQLQCKFDQPLRIPLHSNIRWGLVQRMLDRSYKLRKVRSICCVLRPVLTCAIFSQSTYFFNQWTPWHQQIMGHLYRSTVVYVEDNAMWMQSRAPDGARLCHSHSDETPRVSLLYKHPIQ